MDALGYADGEIVAVCHREVGGGEFTCRLVPATAEAIGAEAFRWVDSSDLYWSVNPLEVPEGYRGRGTAAHVRRWAGIYTDLDVKDGGLPSLEAAQTVIRAVSAMLGHDPVVVIYSGHGAQAVWAMDPEDEATDLAGDDQRRADARALMRRFGRLVAHAAAHVVDEQHRGHVDSVFDLARVLRLPETVNRKDPDAPVPTGVELLDGSPLGVAELAEQLTAYGVTEGAGDRDDPGEVRSEPGDWPWAEMECRYARTTINRWQTDKEDDPSQRHQWLVGLGVRLACMHRWGCLTEELHTRGVQMLAARMHALCNRGDVRKVRPGEVADALSWGQAHAATKTDEEVSREIGGHAKHGHQSTPGGPSEHLSKLWNQRPILRHLHDFARARGAAPAAVLACALARAVAMIPPEYVLPALVGSVGTLNQFYALVGASGDGKGAADGAAQDAVVLVTGLLEDPHPWTDPISHEELYAPDVGSGEGIIHAYATWSAQARQVKQIRSCALFNVPEVDHLAAVGARQGSTLLPMLRKAWSGESLNPQYVDKTKRVSATRHSYRCTLIAGVQPGRAGVLLNDADGGTPQRFVWLPTDDPAAPDEPPDEPLPMQVRIPLPPAGRHVLSVCDEARDAIRSTRQRRLRKEGDALDGHRLYAQEKLAAGLALLDGHLITNGITADDWRLAAMIMDTSDAVREGLAQEQRERASQANRARGRAEAERADELDKAGVQKACNAILTRLGKLPPGEWITGSDLRRSLDRKHRQHFGSAIEHLEAAGQIEVESVEYKGQPGHRYRRRS